MTIEIIGATLPQIRFYFAFRRLGIESVKSRTTQAAIYILAVIFLAIGRSD
jgi:hypothetical protein